MKIFSIFILLLAALFAGGCTKDDPINDYDNIKPVIIIPNSNWPTLPFPAGGVSFPMADATGEIKLYARISSDKLLSKNITVKFLKDENLLNEYNTMWGMSYQMLPDDAWQTNGLTLTIQGGQREAFLPVTIFPNKIDPAQTYLLAFTIAEAEGQTIASNFKSIVIPVTVQ